MGRGTAYQQTLGSELVAAGVEADPTAMYLTKSQIAMIWPYDDQCRLLGEDVWEFDGPREYIRLDPADVLTVAQAAALLAPFIKDLPPFDDGLLPGRAAAAALESVSESVSA